jgi:hypothetical protein
MCNTDANTYRNTNTDANTNTDTDANTYVCSWYYIRVYFLYY